MSKFWGPPQAYHRRYGHYPEVVLGDPFYGIRDNRGYLRQCGIHFAGKPLGRLPKVTEENREEVKRLKDRRREEYLQPIPIEGKFGQGKKRRYRLNYIRAKLASICSAWINSIFLVMNLFILMRFLFFLQLAVLCAKAGSEWLCAFPEKLPYPATAIFNLPFPSR